MFYYWRRAIIGDCAYIRDNTVVRYAVQYAVKYAVQYAVQYAVHYAVSLVLNGAEYLSPIFYKYWYVMPQLLVHQNWGN